MAEQIFTLPFFNRFFGRSHGVGVSVTADAVSVGSLQIDHRGPGEWRIKPCWFWRKIEFGEPANPTASFLLRKADSGIFLQLVEDHRIHCAQQGLIKLAMGQLDEWEELLRRDRYVPRHEVDAWIASATPINLELSPYLSVLRRIAPESPSIRLATILSDPFAVAARRNDAFVMRELKSRQSWFDSFEPPPTSTQREVAIRDETNVLVVAGAGTGKTSAIVSKIRYLLESKIAPPSEILVLAFNTDAAAEIRERVAKYGGDAVTVLTFHALGLRIISDGPGEKLPVLSELSADNAREAVVNSLLTELSADPSFAAKFAKFIFLYPRPLVDRFNSDSEAEYVSRSRAIVTPSLSGHWVRSSEELRIANWLFAHGIEFEYEKPYPHEASGRNKTTYRPDFTITIAQTSPDGVRSEKNVYLEHQALNRNGEAPKWMTGYKDKVDWARSTHRKNGTALVESFSWWFQNGIWEKELSAALKKAGVEVADVDWKARLEAAEASESTRLQADRKLVLGLFRRTLDLVRCSADVPEIPAAEAPTTLFSALESKTQKGSDSEFREAEREDLFQELFAPLQHAYEAYKKHRQGIDFEDMIFLARQVVKSGGFKAPWSYYIVDEFQDASLSRLELVLSLRGQRPDSRLTCIGDDWQAIIRFAGGDIRVMTQFERRVGPHWRADLAQTFRYPPTIAAVSSTFVTTNPNQLKKKIVPAAGRADLPIRILFTGSLKERKEGSLETYNDVLYTELEAIKQMKADASVLLLSRYRRGIPEREEQSRICSAFPTLKLSWSTVHRSKGGEADAVIVGGLDDDAYGFPCVREDDPIIRKYLPPEDSYEHAEERRLFYVAMTRAKMRLTLIANAQAPSPFVREIVSSRPGGRGLEIVSSGEPSKPCPKCSVGYLLTRDGTNGRFFTCSKSPVCTHKEEACPRCRRGFLQVVGERVVCSSKGCGHESRLCPDCKIGWLVIKTNHRYGNKFLACTKYFDEDVACGYTQSISIRS